jgi:hypothetical protein
VVSIKVDLKYMGWYGLGPFNFAENGVVGGL